MNRLIFCICLFLGILFLSTPFLSVKFDPFTILTDVLAGVIMFACAVVAAIKESNKS